jgi:hypothetical protein
MADFFEDVGKSADDMFAKGFPSGGLFKVSSETKTSNGVTFTSSASRSVKKGAEVVEAIIEPKFNVNQYDTELTGKFSTLSNYELGVGKKNIGLDGSKLSLTATQAAATTRVKLGFDVKQEQFAIKSSFDYPLDESASNPAKASASAIVRYGDFAIGDQIGYKLGGDSVDWSIKVGYFQPSYQVVGNYNHTDNRDCGVSFYQKVTNALRFAAAFKIDRNKKNPPAAQIAADYQYTDVIGLKSKLAISGNAFRLGAALSQKWNSNATITLGADLNALELLGSAGGEAHTFGLEVKLA